MMSRRLIFEILFLISASVFLCSCGIPTYWQPSNSTVITKVSSSSDDVEFNVNVDCYSGEEIPASAEGGVGLILFYQFSDDTYNSDFSALQTAFNKSIRGTIPNGLTTIRFNFDKPVLTFSDSDSKERYLYAFTVSDSADTDFTITGAPDYIYRLNSYNPMHYGFFIDFDNDSDIPSYQMKISEKNSLFAEKYLGICNSSCRDQSSMTSYFNESLINSYDYIHIYAAVSAQSNSFSNIYWSDIRYVGSFDLN